MTRKDEQECFVYITLPGATEPVTAGRFVINTKNDGTILGRFVYGKSYLERDNAVAIDPVQLTLKEGTFETASLNGMFGALRDAGPDHWGRRVIERHAGKSALSEMDYLLYAPDDRAGALGFGLNQIPPAPKRLFNKTLDLVKLQTVADALIRDEPIAQTTSIAQMDDLLLIGTSMGGARPKAVVENEEGLWLAKFNRPDDPWNMARVELAMLHLAKQCGIQTATSTIADVGGRDVLLVKRFDRSKTSEGYTRARMISALTLLGLEETPVSRAGWSYIAFAEELRRVSAAPQEDAAELYRRMVFNALISNTDDHPRNHALIAKTKDWRLSPAYDLTPSVPVSTSQRDLALICGDQGRFANAGNLLSQSARFLLNREEAQETIIALTQQIRASWYKTARSEGVSESDCQKIAGAFAYPGFDA